jgi:hypothetical protein
MPKSDLLAVAFTDLNGNDKYNPGKDTLIAAIVDTNNDGIVSVGDTVQFGTYPLIPDGSESGTGGTYLAFDRTITQVDFTSSTAVQVETGTVGSVGFFATPNEETFRTTGLALESELNDSINFLTVPDTIFTNTTALGPGAPNTDIDVSALQPGDQAFLDVFIAGANGGGGGSLATLSQEGTMVDTAIHDLENFVHVIDGGTPLREPVVQGTVEGSLGGPDTLIAINLALNPPAFGDPGIPVISQTVEQEHLELNLTVDLTPERIPTALDQSPSEMPPPPVAVSQEAPVAKPDFELVGDTFTFSNQAVTIEGHLAIDVPQETVTVESVALTTPQETTIELGIQDVVVPNPIVEHFDLI